MSFSVRPWAGKAAKSKLRSKLGRGGWSPEKKAKKAARFLKNFGSDDLRKEITRHGCCRCRDWRGRKIEAAHIQSRGAGYQLEKAALVDREDAYTGNVVPLCKRCHTTQNDWLGAEIDRLQAVADELFGLLYDEHFLPLRKCSACPRVVFDRNFRPFADGSPGGICSSCDEALERAAPARRSIAAAFVVAGLLLASAAGAQRFDRPRWADFDRDGKDTRAEVLEALCPEVRWDAAGRRVTAATCLDLYAGSEISTDSAAQAIQIDHIFPAVRAWRARDKSDLMPAEWCPASRGARRVVARRFRGTAVRWSLPLTASDLIGLAAWDLGLCAPGARVLGGAR